MFHTSKIAGGFFLTRDCQCFLHLQKGLVQRRRGGTLPHFYRSCSESLLSAPVPHRRCHTVSRSELTCTRSVCKSNFHIQPSHFHDKLVYKETMIIMVSTSIYHNISIYIDGVYRSWKWCFNFHFMILSIQKNTFNSGRCLQSRSDLHSWRFVDMDAEENFERNWKAAMMGFHEDIIGYYIPSGKHTKSELENGHRNSGFTH